MSLNIATFAFNPFQENTYVVWDGTGEAVVIDAGNYSAAEDRRLSDFIREKGLTPVMALNTHGHVDHLLGVRYVTDTYNIPFALHSGDGFLVDSCVEHGRLYGFQVTAKPEPGRDLKGEEEVRFGDTALKIIPTPGHTPGHVCFWSPENRVLFTGDTLFKESIGRTDLPGGDYRWIMRSILDGLMPLGGDVVFHPGHGPQSTLGHEALYNPFVVEVMNGEVNV